MPTFQQIQQELAQANAELIEQKRLTEQARRIAIKLEEEVAYLECRLFNTFLFDNTRTDAK